MVQPVAEAIIDAIKSGEFCADTCFVLGRSSQ
jgi:hypothetical protein